ncbi:unnamed protein product [Meganyctiphanes norvegica]|uniref:Uncharacterized protein n=1 Tax=Meganyctiphanes norvegica TaxID=48144 RepID=A0AAV2QK46_MEGNR
MVGRLLREDNSMMGPIMQEDEYTISVKLRRPVDAPCALPPVISLDANNQSVFVSPSDNATIMHAHATKMVDGIPQPVTIGGATLPRRLPALMAPLSTELTGMNQTQSLSRKHIKEGKGHIVLDMHSIENENAPQRPPPPPMLDCKTLVPVSKGISPTRTENTRTDNGVTHGCLQLPIVQVFAADNSLVAKNNFKAPIKIMEDSDDSKMLVVPSDNKVVESGSLFVPRIAQHCRGDGELYVPPVDEQNLKTLKKEVPVARGNSKRNRNKQNGSLVTKNAANKSIPAIIFESVPPSPSENYLARDPKKIELNTVTSPTKPNVTLNTMSPGSLSVIPTSQQFQSSNVSTKEEIHDSDVKTSIVSKRQTRPRLTLNTMSPGSLLVTAPPTISPDITPKIAPEVPPRFIVKNLTSGFDEINTNKTAPPTLVRSSSRVATARAHLSGMLNQHMERNPSLHKYSSTMPRKPFSPKLFTQRTRSSPLPNLNSQPYSPTSRASFSPAFITQMNSPDTPPVSKRGPNISQPFSPEPPPRSILPWFAPRPNPESPSSEIHSPIYTPMSTPPISAEDSGIMPSFTHIIQDDTHSPTATSCTSSPDWTIDYVSPRGSIYYAYKGDESNSSEEEDSSSATTTPSSPDYPDDLGKGNNNLV